MTNDMRQDRELYASELKTMLREALLCAIQGKFSSHPGDPYFYTQKAYPMQTEIDGLPLRTRVIDIETVGAGGGSIARLDSGGVLHVGPESAGAVIGVA